MILLRYTLLNAGRGKLDFDGLRPGGFMQPDNNVSVAAKAVLCLIVLCSPLLRADTLYSNPSEGPAASVAIAITNPYAVEDDFILGLNSTITSAVFRAWTSPQDAITQVGWTIRADAGGAPGAALFSGTASPAATLASYQGLDFYDVNDYSFSLSLSLSAGVYWLRLENAVTQTPGEFAYWEGTSAGVYTPGNGLISGGGFDGSPIASDLVFTIEGTQEQPPIVPEPATLILLGSGLAGALVRRRKRV